MQFKPDHKHAVSLPSLPLCILNVMWQIKLSKFATRIWAGTETQNHLIPLQLLQFSAVRRYALAAQQSTQQLDWSWIRGNIGSRAY